MPQTLNQRDKLHRNIGIPQTYSQHECITDLRAERSRRRRAMAWFCIPVGFVLLVAVLAAMKAFG